MELGIVVRDKITDFKGTITGLVYYISGCNQALVVPTVKSDGSFIDGQWFDLQRLEPVEGEKKVTLDNKLHSGADIPPSRRG